MPFLRFTRFLAASAFAFGALPLPATAAQAPQIAARSYILLDSGSHRVMLVSGLLRASLAAAGGIR